MTEDKQELHWGNVVLFIGAIAFISIFVYVSVGLLIGIFEMEEPPLESRILFSNNESMFFDWITMMSEDQTELKINNETYEKVSCNELNNVGSDSGLCFRKKK